MCGISGAVGAIDDEIRAAVGRMHDAQVHRGPDADGRWEHSERGVGACFAHRRLSILDLSPLGRQPMRHEPSGHVVCFNGEIYGFQSLRRELAARGERFRSQSDTEVILAGYATWGRDVLARLRGMFAFALWDARSRTVLLARDRLGIKPLFFAETEDFVLVASEQKALFASGLLTPRIDPDRLADVFSLGYPCPPHSLFAGVRELPPAHTALASGISTCASAATNREPKTISSRSRSHVAVRGKYRMESVGARVVMSVFSFL